MQRANKNEAHNAVSYCVMYMENKFTEYAWIYAGRIINFTSYNMIWEERKNRNKNRWRMEFFSLFSSSFPSASFFSTCMQPPISSHSDEWKKFHEYSFFIIQSRVTEWMRDRKKLLFEEHKRVKFYQRQW